MLTKTNRILVVSVLLFLMAYVQIGQTPGHIQVVNASSLASENVPLIRSKPHSELIQVPQHFSSTSPLPQIEWQRLEFPILPLPRVGSSLTLNPVNNIALIFGGIHSTIGELNDLWLTNGHVWMEFHTPHSPESRSDASMTYDELRHVAILFGGIGDSKLLGDTWLFTGVDWIQQHPLISPSPRTSASMAYDAERNVNILFGGLVNTGGNLQEASNEMWIWDGEIWKQLFPASLPPARWGANMVYDHARKSIILFGGSSGGGFLDDTWSWDGASWVELNPLHQPAGRANYGMTYDQYRKQVILFGGQNGLETDPNDTWAWDGMDWTQLQTRQAPPEELAYGAQLVYLPELQTVVLFNALREKMLVSETSYTNTDQSELWALISQNLIFLPFIYDQ